MIDLYEPSMSEKGLQIRLHSGGPLILEADAALIHRMIANLFDNELKHLPSACTVNLRLSVEDNAASLLLEDDGPGFDPEVLPHLFERRIKGKNRLGTAWDLPSSMQLRAPTAAQRRRSAGRWEFEQPWRPRWRPPQAER
jgi:signal transduction histidine kinase